MKPRPITVDTNDAQQAESFRLYMDKVLAHRVTPQVWNWEYGYNNDKLVLTALQFENDLVGSQNFLPIELVVNGESIWTVKSENSFVDAAHRGGGTFKELYEHGVAACEQKNIRTIWGFTAVVKAWRDKLGFAVQEDWMHSSHLQLGMLKDYGAYGFVKGLGARLFHSFSAYRNRARLKQRVVSTPAGFVWRDAFTGDDLNDVLNRVLSNETVRLDMHRTYFDWRVTSNPNVQYKSSFLYDARNALQGYFIYSLHQGVAFLAEVVFDAQYKQAVWSKLIESLLNENISSLHYFANVHHAWCRQTFNELESLGARTLPNRDMNFVLRTSDPMVKPLTNNAAVWYMHALWTEGFRM